MTILDFTNCGHKVIICPNSDDGSAMDCHSFCSFCEGFGEYCETCGGKPIKQKDYRLNAYADGFGVWHCEIFFTTPLGNTGEADRVAFNAMAAAKRKIRQEIADRMAGRPRRLAYQVVKNESQLGSGRLLSLTIAEK